MIVLEDRERHLGAGLPAAERAALAVGIVVADPHGDRHVVGEADEPGVVLVVGRAGLAGDERRKAPDCALAVPRCEHALQHRLQLIERHPIGRSDPPPKRRPRAGRPSGRCARSTRSRAAPGARPRWRSPHRTPRGRSAAPAGRPARTDSSARIPCRPAPPARARRRGRGCPRDSYSMPPSSSRTVTRFLEFSSARRIVTTPEAPLS